MGEEGQTRTWAWKGAPRPAPEPERRGGGGESHVMPEGAQVCGGGDSVEEAERED